MPTAEGCNTNRRDDSRVFIKQHLGLNCLSNEVRARQGSSTLSSSPSEGARGDEIHDGPLHPPRTDDHDGNCPSKIPNFKGPAWSLTKRKSKWPLNTEKKCSVYLVVKGMQIKIRHFWPIKLIKIKNHTDSAQCWPEWSDTGTHTPTAGGDGHRLFLESNSGRSTIYPDLASLTP